MDREKKFLKAVSNMILVSRMSVDLGCLGAGELNSVGSSFLLVAGM